MLVLTRKLDESIIINENIEVVVVEIKENTVKLGIKAPKEIKILRKEIFEEIRKENIEAAQSSNARLPQDLGQLLSKRSNTE
jgi:carbon storage regulator